MDPPSSTPDGEYDYFGTAGAAPATPAAVPPPVAPAGRFGGPPGPAGPAFGTPAGPAFGTPAGPGFVVAPAPYAAPKQGVPTGVKVVIGLVGTASALVIIGIIAAIAIPVFLNDRAQQTFDDTSIAMPQSVAGYTQIQTAQARGIVDTMLKDVGNGSYTDAMGGVFNDAQGRPAIVMALKGDEPATEGHLDALTDVFAGLQTSGAQLSSVAPISPGSLGGQLQCGVGSIDGQSMRACAGVDVAAASVMVFFDPNVTDQTVVAMREAVVVRS